MKTIVEPRYRRFAVVILASGSVLVSLLAAYVKLYFWGGTRFASIEFKLAFWFIIVAGPLSLTLALRKPLIATMIAVAQLALIAAMSI